jgi:GTPase SAR1 family protein
MSTAFQRLVSRFYSGAESRHATILGLDSGGKTTILYLLKIGEIVQTISTLGFNIEEVDVPLPTKGNKTSGKSFNVTIWDLGTGCATIRQFYYVIRNYLAVTNAVIWVVDSSDRSRLSESVEMFGEVLKGVDMREDVQVNRMKVPILM